MRYGIGDWIYLEPDDRQFGQITYINDRIYVVRWHDNEYGDQRWSGQVTHYSTMYLEHFAKKPMDLELAVCGIDPYADKGDNL